MRIAFVVDCFPHARAGTERQLSILIKALSARAEVHVIVLRPSDWLFANARELGVTAHFAPFSGLRSPSSWAALVSLWRCIRQLKPDIVHTFLPVSNIVGVLAARIAGVPRILASRRDFGEWMTPAYLSATRFANRFVDHIVTNAPRVRQLTVDEEGFPFERISVIYNGMNVGAFRGLPRDESLLYKAGVPQGATVAGLVANFRPMKRHETAVRAAQLLKAAGENVHILFIGANAMPYDLREQTRAKAVELGVADTVHFVEDTENVPAYLGVFDIGINCSEGEGLSNAIMEYMAAGIPVTAAASGGNPDLIEHEKTGLLFDLDDAAGLAANITRLARKPQLAYTLADAARRYAEAQFDLHAMADHFHSLYVKLVGSPGGRGQIAAPSVSR